MTQAITVKEIASRIDAHLHRFEADPSINRRPDYGSRPYLLARAFASGRWVQICYVDYHRFEALPKADAERYLAWLDAGNVGRHWEMP